MFSEAKITGNFTNHSLRATGATELFQSEAPEKVIQGITGHHSVSALQQHERPGDLQLKAACNILTAASSHIVTIRKQKRLITLRKTVG